MTRSEREAEEVGIETCIKGSADQCVAEQGAVKCKRIGSKEEAKREALCKELGNVARARGTEGRGGGTRAKQGQCVGSNCTE